MGLHNRKGFTLVEIMIVVAIIALIAAIAIPNLLRARHNANEGAAVGNMHTVLASIESFRAVQAPPSYPADWTTLATAIPAYLDPVLQTGSKQGYLFAYTPTDSDGDGTFDVFTVTADPITVGVTGTRGFFGDESGVIRASASGTATVADSPIG